ncbi:MAG: glyoxylate carboligase [Desulfobacterales bacterium]|nr:glyoxylate carboligase [Desulfobacterales bacterium]
MTKMRAIEAAVHILRKEGLTNAFGVPGAAINPLYSAMREIGGIRHFLARHVEGASHMAEGFTRAAPGNIGVCIGTSGPGGTDMITGLYSAAADSIPILCLTGQAPCDKLRKEDFQAVDIESIAKPLTKMSVTILEPGQLPSIFQKALYLMRSDRPGPVLIDLPIDVQMAEINFNPDDYVSLKPSKPTATRAQAEKALSMLNGAQRPLIVAGGGIINADASDLLVAFAELTGVPVIPTLMGWGAIPDDHQLMQGRVGLQTSDRYGNATYLRSDFVFGIGNRWANRHTGSIDAYTEDRTFIHVDIEPTQIGRIFAPDLGIVSDAKAALELFIEVAAELKAEGFLPDRTAWVDECQHRKRSMLRKTDYDQVPMKPQRVYQAMNEILDRDTCYVTTIGLSQIAGAQFLKVYNPRNWINAAQAGPLGWTMPAALGVRAALPDKKIVALSGDYDFQFLVEELAVGAQHKLPYMHILVNNSYLGLIRQSQRGFDMEFQVSLGFDNINVSDEDDAIACYGVDHVALAEALGCKAIRVHKPEDFREAFTKAEELMERYQVPVVVECMLEPVTNISMGAELNCINEFEEILCLDESLSAEKGWVPDLQES